MSLESCTRNNAQRAGCSVLFFFILVFLSACATAPVVPKPVPVTAPPPPEVAVKAEQPRYPTVYEFEIPKSMTFCGQTLDLNDPNIREMFDREFTVTVWDNKQVFMWIKRAGRYFPYIEKKLAEKGLPDDLKYLAVAESSLHPHIKSSAGALGMWQMVEDTARRYGLRIDRGVMDERQCYMRSTEAAMKYLKDLYNMFGDWYLAVAAYNCGEYMVNNSMRKQNNDNYFKLHLPRETERYVFRIVTIKYILENLQKFGYSPDPERIFKPLEFKKIVVDVDEKIFISDLSDICGFTYKEFVDLNPKILSNYLPHGNYSLNIPKGYDDKFIAAMENLRDPDFRKKHNYGKKYYTVKQGDVLSTISWETGVSMATIKHLNHMGSNAVKPGQRLLIRE